MTTISEERIERAAKAHARVFCDSGNNTFAAMQAALEADASALVAAKIEGMMDARRIVVDAIKGADSLIARYCADLLDDRIAALRAEMEKAGG